MPIPNNSSDHGNHGYVRIHNHSELMDNPAVITSSLLAILAIDGIFSSHGLLLEAGQRIVQLLSAKALALYRLCCITV